MTLEALAAWTGRSLRTLTRWRGRWEASARVNWGWVDRVLLEIERAQQPLSSASAEPRRRVGTVLLRTRQLARVVSQAIATTKWMGGWSLANLVSPGPVVYPYGLALTLWF